MAAFAYGFSVSACDHEQSAYCNPFSAKCHNVESQHPGCTQRLTDNGVYSAARENGLVRYIANYILTMASNAQIYMRLIVCIKS